MLSHPFLPGVGQGRQPTVGDEAADELGLTKGSTVTVVVKASDVILAVD